MSDSGDTFTAQPLECLCPSNRAFTPRTSLSHTPAVPFRPRPPPACDRQRRQDIEERERLFRIEANKATMYFLPWNPCEPCTTRTSTSRAALCSPPPKSPNPVRSPAPHPPHPGGNTGANHKSISHRCHPILVAFVWELTEQAIDLPLGCLQGGSCEPVPAATPGLV